MARFDDFKYPIHPREAIRVMEDNTKAVGAMFFHMSNCVECDTRYKELLGLIFDHMGGAEALAELSK